MPGTPGGAAQGGDAAGRALQDSRGPGGEGGKTVEEGRERRRCRGNWSFTRGPVPHRGGSDGQRQLLTGTSCTVPRQSWGLDL